MKKLREEKFFIEKLLRERNVSYVRINGERILAIYWF